MAGRSMAAALALSLWLAGTVRAEENEDLARAERLVDGLRYGEAVRVLEAARAQTGNDRSTLLRILELQGIVAASLGRAEQARSAFRLLVVLEPSYVLKGKYSPKVTTPFYEAKGWVTDHGSLRFEPVPAVVDNGRVELVVARVESDPLKLARDVRFHVQESPKGDFREVVVPLQGGLARVAVKGEPVRWWAELLGERDEVLEQIGSAEKPVVDTARQEPKKPAVAAAQAPAVAPGAVVLTPRSFSYVAGGGAVVALGVGVFLGIQSNQNRAMIANAEKDAQGRVIGLTQKQAYNLDAQARGQALAANILFGGAAALAATAGVLWTMGNSQPPPVAVIPGPRGIAITGVLP